MIENKHFLVMLLPPDDAVIDAKFTFRLILIYHQQPHAGRQIKHKAKTCV